MEMELAIKRADEKLDLLSSDPHTIQRYKVRGSAEHGKANLYSLGKEEDE